MIYYSTENPIERVTMREAVVSCVPRSGGLYMPASLPRVPHAFLQNMGDMSLREIAYATTNVFLGEDVDSATIKRVVDTSLSFDTPMIDVGDNLYILELFHGPTRVFKDIGARFMAELFSSMNPHDGTRLNVLVATNGNTGLAVAEAFAGKKDINVFILYPQHAVNRLTALTLGSRGDNIYAVEVAGTIDDCKSIVSAAFADKTLREDVLLSSANSTNFARLMPQVALFFYAIGRLKDKGLKPTDITVSVPSGNLGMLASGLMAKRIGLECGRLIAACNANNAFDRYLNTGVLEVHPTAITKAPLMDMASPSNLPRLRALCPGGLEELRNDIGSANVDDDLIEATMARISDDYSYLIDPHTAVGVAALNDIVGKDIPRLVMATAHPDKNDFKDNVRVARDKVQSKALASWSRPYRLPPTYPAFKKYLLSKQ